MHYNLMNKMVQKIMPNEVDKGSLGKRYFYNYDKFEALIKTTDPLGSVLRMFYDGNGNKIKEVSPSNYNAETDDGLGVVYKYDSRDRLVEVVDEFGNTVNSFKYNSVGKVTEEIDANGKTTYFNYNKGGLITSKYTPKSEEITKNGVETLYNYEEFYYNKNGQVVEEKKSNQYVLLNQRPTNFNVITYKYNDLGAVRSVTDSTGANYTRSIDKFGNVELEKKVINDKHTEITRNTYDLANRLVESKKYLENNELAITTYEYDKNGNVVKIVTPKGHKIVREYNEVDKLVREIFIEKGEDTKERAFEYDKAYNLVKEVDVNGNVATLEYNFKNQPLVKTDREGNSTRYVYTPNGKIVKEILPEEYDKNGDNGLGTTYVYNEKDLLVEKVNALGISEVKLSYNVDGTLKSETDAVGVTTEYSYDVGGRVTKVTKAQKLSNNDVFRVVTEQREYDALDSVTKSIDGEGNVTTYDLDNLGRVEKLNKADGSSEVYVYDKAGNVTKAIDGNGNGISYIFGYHNKLDKIVDQDGLEEIFTYGLYLFCRTIVPITASIDCLFTFIVFCTSSMKCIHTIILNFLPQFFLFDSYTRLPLSA